ncbi:MAG TPA: N-acetylmuramic acid 6-phosphate etherase [Planctomycetota bacterium]|nr:N-acetylmuramic acid 6-phosphate etherase [Planctomycetota bacterium]
MEPVSREHLATEQQNAASADLDRLDIAQALQRMQLDDITVHAALYRAQPAIARAIEVVVERLARGGRLIYVGAGTSGRLGLLDALECPPTFQTPPDKVQAVLAGGEAALRGAVEGAEDDGGAARAELERRGLGEDDVVFGIAAGGTTPFVHAAIELARERGAASVFLACVPFEQAPDQADVSVRVVTGPEFLTGSTRLKAGTATKLVLNAVTTIAMARLGRVYGNWMVDLDTARNAKLEERGVRIVAALTGLERGAARELLQRAGGQVKVAVLAKLRGLEPEDAVLVLERHGGFLRAALEEE